MKPFELTRLVLRDESNRLTPIQKLVLITLIDRADQEMKCWPSQSLLSRQTGLASRTIRKSIKGLLELGFIKLVRSGKGRTCSNMYLVTPYLSPEKGNEVPHLSPEKGNEVPHLSPEKRNEVPHLSSEKGNKVPYLRNKVPYLRNEVPMGKASCAYKDIQEDIHEDIHEEGQQPKNSSTSKIEIETSKVAFVLGADWKPNNSFLKKEAILRNITGLFVLDHNYRRKMLDNFKRNHVGKNKAAKSEEEWNRLFCKSIEVQLRMDDRLDEVKSIVV